MLAGQSGAFMLYYEKVLPPLLPLPVPYTESVMTRSLGGHPDGTVDHAWSSANSRPREEEEDALCGE